MAESKPSEFRAFLSRDWHRWLTDYPELATSVGLSGLNDRWTDDSEAGLARRHAHLKETAQELAGFDRGRLDAADQLNYDLYRSLVDDAIEGVRFGFDPLPYNLGQPSNLRYPLSQMDGVHLMAPSMLEMAPKAHVSDWEDRIRRLEALPAAIEQSTRLLQEGLRLGYSAPQFAIRGVPDQIAALTPEDPDRSGLLESFRDWPLSISETEQTRLRAAARGVYRDRVRPALVRFREFVTETYLPACRSSIACSELPDGPAIYAYLARRSTTTDLTPQQIHEIGLREVARLRSEMDRLIRSTGFEGSFREFNDFLRNDPKFHWKSAEALVDGYRVIGKKTDPQLTRLFATVPRLQYGVLPVPEFRAESSPGAYYQSGSIPTGRPGYFYANTYKLESRPRWEMEALSLHEAVPGHHLQLAIMQELDGLPEFRRETGPTAFIEGWGLYAESLGEELGLYTDPYSKYGQLTFDVWRSTRLVVDTGMHVLGWTRDQAIDFFRQNTGLSDVNVGVEVDRYIVWPGQALAYKIGQLRFRELRTEAERRLGSRFDVREFHDLLLREGALPLSLVSARVAAWVARAAT
jgi:uncharacterized protein (DUF885 family)